jgi:membrane protein implicated in regulation of membrane protease activity
MTWADFYLFCFLFGFLFSFAALISGHLHLDMHGGHGGHVDAGAAHGGHHPHMGQHVGQHVGQHDTGSGHDAHDGRSQLSVFNMGTLAAFLAWFGGAGYLATSYYRLWFLTGLGIAAVAGVVGSSIVFWFVSKVLMRGEENLDPAAFDMIGVLGTVTGCVRTGGTGEIIFSQNGTRRAAPVRSEDGSAIPTGVEVVVTRYSDGIAYVRRWDELTNA